MIPLFPTPYTPPHTITYITMASITDIRNLIENAIQHDEKGLGKPSDTDGGWALLDDFRDFVAEQVLRYIATLPAPTPSAPVTAPATTKAKAKRKSGPGFNNFLKSMTHTLYDPKASFTVGDYVSASSTLHDTPYSDEVAALAASNACGTIDELLDQASAITGEDPKHIRTVSVLWGILEPKERAAIAAHAMTIAPAKAAKPSKKGTRTAYTEFLSVVKAAIDPKAPSNPHTDLEVSTGDHFGSNSKSKACFERNKDSLTLDTTFGDLIHTVRSIVDDDPDVSKTAKASTMRAVLWGILPEDSRKTLIS